MSNEIEVILVDVGNSYIKSILVKDGILGEEKRTESIDEIVSQYTKVPIMVSDVRGVLDNYESDKRFTFLNPNLKLPIKLDYKTPNTLGVDRVAGAVGAFDEFPNQNSLVFDLGTCMTVDLLDATNIYRGGVIAPGLKMRMRAMANQTSKLPDISDFWQEIECNGLGKSTDESLVNGTFWAMTKEIEAIIIHYRQKFANINIILTGGDAHFFESKIKEPIFVRSKILQRGLYRIWKNQ